MVATFPRKGEQWSPELREKILASRARDSASDWPHGAFSRPARNAFCALMQITGKPSLARQLMDELELWTDDRRPPETLWRKWAKEWREGQLNPKPKTLAAVQKQYDGLRRADMDESIRKANVALRHIADTVINDEFNKDTSGALQHLQNFVSIGTEKRQQAFDPRVKDEVRISPTFVLQAPPERRQLDDGNTVEGTVISRG